MSKRNWRIVVLALGALALSLLVSACTQQTENAPAPTGSSSIEVVHASYMDIAGTISEARARVADWTNGDQSAIPLAEERLKKVDTLIAKVGWPAEMATAIADTKAASAAMGTVLKDSDLAAAEAASTSLGDASHDITHAFYGDWLPAMKGMPASPMAMHAAYLDLTLNVGDLRTRVEAWDKGEESNIGVAKEKVERIGAVGDRLADFGLLTGPLTAVTRELPFMAAALERKDLEVAKQTLGTIEKAISDLSRGFDAWLGIAAGTTDPACLQASYLEAQRRSTAIQSGIAQWRKGDNAGLNLAQAELSRLEAALAHPVWSEQLITTTDKMKAAALTLSQALETKDQSRAEIAGKELGEAAYYVAHAYYAYWLPTGVLVDSVAQTGGAQTASTAGGHGDSHGAATTAGGTAANEGPNWLVIGGFGAVMAAVVGAAWMLKRAMVTEATTATADQEPAAV